MAPPWRFLNFLFEPQKLGPPRGWGRGPREPKKSKKNFFFIFNFFPTHTRSVTFQLIEKPISDQDFTYFALISPDSLKGNLKIAT